MNVSISSLFPLISLLLALWAVALRKKNSRYKNGIAWFAGLAMLLNIILFVDWLTYGYRIEFFSVMTALICIVFLIIAVAKKNGLLIFYSVVLPIIIAMTLVVDYSSYTPSSPKDDAYQEMVQTTAAYSESVYVPETSYPVESPTSEWPFGEYEYVYDTVYTTSPGVFIYPVNSENPTVSLSIYHELYRIARSDTWSIVEFNGEQYYIENENISR